MNKLVTLIFLLNSVIVFCQKIDYNNFDNKMATNALKNAFMGFRDTINSFGGGNKWNVDYPEVDSFPEMNKPRWSDWLYNTISLKNCSELINDYNLDPYHVDKSEWFKVNKDLIRKEYYKDFNDIPSDLLNNARLAYSENAISLDYEVET